MRLIIRADGGSGVLGFGHLARCATLARAVVSSGHDVTFVTLPLDNEIGAEWLRARGWTPVVTASPVDAIAALQPDVVVADGYHFQPADVAALDAIAPVMMLADVPAPEHAGASLLLNPHPGADAADFGVVADDHLFGVQYLLLDVGVAVGTVARQPGRVLVTFGGSDVRGMTPRVVGALGRSSDLILDVILGPGVSAEVDRDTQRAVAACTSQASVARNVSDLPARMRRCAVAVTQPSTTAYELCATGTPTVAVTTSGDQAQVARGLSALGAIEHVGEADDGAAERVAEAVRELLASAPRRRTLSERASDVVDGEGPRRVVRALEHLAERRK